MAESGGDAASAALARVRAAAAKVTRGHGRVRPATLSSARPDDRDPQQLGRLFDVWVRGNGHGADLAVAGLVAQWPQIVGEQVAAHVRVAAFTSQPDGGHLVLQADSQEWALQVRYLAGQLRRRIDSELGAGVVVALDIQGPGGRHTPGRWRVRSGRRSPR